ncbi:MAG: coproporphyrinogen oxidase [Rickettsiaceae bacterium]|jgi:putative membrane protein|nr:coproporphyrinogen oxidase [Rickettsiaceae bacterium]
MENYLLIKSLHLISIIAWMAGMLYLPRLYVYHTSAKSGGELDETLKIMERRLLRFIINPAMILTIIFGIILVTIVGKEGLGGWFHAKFLLVIVMFAVHGMLAKYRKDFEKGQNKHSAKFYRILNEVPTVLLIIIVFLAVMKPF